MQHPELYQKDMGSACVYEEKTAIYELFQGKEMAKQLRVNLHSPEARDFLIQKILSSYENALLVLKSGCSAGQPRPPALPAPSLPESSIFIGSPGSEEFKFDKPFSSQQGADVISKKRKGSTTWEDEVRICGDNGQKDILGTKLPRSYYECSYPNAQVQRRHEETKVFETPYNGKHNHNHGIESATPPPPLTTTEKTILTQTNQLSSSNPSEISTNLKANLSMNTSDLDGDTVPSFGYVEDYHQLHLENHYEDELMPIYSTSYISPATPESMLLWESSPLLNFPTIW